ncbi:hypothetical protein O6H91_11G065400 [Diphasiastrum complanatum]|uniref:Uncharacterized protein n=2 Tax=Diphasiastrum complanatum TaxID=34168 RepID=A0ACC2CB13_DIPCM|nr:hypothetical protein O6H91_11G065400 [Diphasiastrum complanatum]KAJ7538848.1 hypothetical protein O6H91_11G065400 [Diphasiastrum complanatum]
MGSQKTCEISVEEQQLTNKEFYFSWSKHLPVKGQAKDPPDFQLETSVVHKGNLQLVSPSKHRQTLKREFRTVSAISPQHQEHVVKPLPVKILPTIGASTSLLITDNLKLQPRKKLKSSTSHSFPEENQKCMYPVVEPHKRESDSLSKGQTFGQAATGRLLLENHKTEKHKFECQLAPHAQNHAAKLHQDGKSLSLPLVSQQNLALTDFSSEENLRVMYSSEGPMNFHQNYPCAIRHSQNPSVSGSPTCGTSTSPASGTVSQKDIHALPLAPQKPKDSQRLTHVSKRGLDHNFEKQQIVAPNHQGGAAASCKERLLVQDKIQSQKNSDKDLQLYKYQSVSGGERVLEINAMQPTKSLSKSAAYFQAQNSAVIGNNLGEVRGENFKLDFLLDACTQASKMSSAVLKKVSFTDKAVPGQSVGSQMTSMRETEINFEPCGASKSMASCAEADRFSSSPGQSASVDDGSFKELIASVAMEETARHFVRSKLLMLPAHAPMPVAAPIFSSGEPSLPLLMNCLQRPSESVQTSTHCYKDCPAPPHISYSDLQKSPTSSQSPENMAEKNSSCGRLLVAHQKRFINLQAFLRLCDETDQTDLLQALRSLSAAARSGHAFNLETRALKLSVEEGKEMIRLKMLNVMGRSLHPKHQTADIGSTPAGLRLPAPGMPTICSSQNA